MLVDAEDGEDCRLTTSVDELVRDNAGSHVGPQCKARVGTEQQQSSNSAQADLSSGIEELEASLNIISARDIERGCPCSVSYSSAAWRRYEQVPSGMSRRCATFGIGDVLSTARDGGGEVVAGAAGCSRVGIGYHYERQGRAPLGFVLA